MMNKVLESLSRVKYGIGYWVVFLVGFLILRYLFG